ncbi:pilus assembly protein PilM [Gorillibacterium sp. CAU 1737]|uniref:type IV pilus biogenesis protein PilM n=1 Tax=Gorillibacterium sp. CAU 1737 TaxID=3140362 RepID=UPI0032611619
MRSSLWTRIKPGKTLLGMEITEEEVKLCELAADRSERPKVLAHASAQLPAGTMNDGRLQDAGKLEEALRGLLADTQWGTRRVHMAIPSQSVLVKVIHLPDVPDGQLDKLIRYELTHQVKLPFDRPYYDYTRLQKRATPTTTAAGVSQGERRSEKSKFRALATKDLSLSHWFRRSGHQEAAAARELGQHGEPLLAEVLVVAAPMEMLEDYVRLLDRVGLVPQSFEIKAFSLMRLQEACMPLREASWILIDVNERTTDLTIVEHGVIRLTRNMELSFAQAAPPVSSLQANVLLSSLFSPDHAFANACQDLVSELERLLTFYRYTLDNRHMDVSAIVLSGSLDRMDELADSLAVRTNRTVYRYADGAVEWKESAWSAEREPTAAFAVPIGLALRGEGA